ncbi:hypothetical protein SANT12839_024920 [Streptomyces antimycoticus]|uniref:Uncharacterized protein n=1 Tax=Streptomyces antimycoticus TaxID=68175 RepID=A0A4D4K3F9_9ACTN|nr:hypothetical protein SANT12839_024920 [Streptomyces antimycoticus]
MGLAAERLLGLLVEQDHLTAGVGQFGGGGEAREPRADHDHVRVVRHGVVSVLVSPPTPADGAMTAILPTAQYGVNPGCGSGFRPLPARRLPPRNLDVEQKVTIVHRDWTRLGQPCIINDHG